ncbi:MAG: ATP-binding protein, partial [Bacteroidales bacterium]|nr:ATP-binding protein [Bacteroidales bacterium]
MGKMFLRQLQPIIEQKLFQGKALIILGPRQVGKSTLLNMISDGLKKDMLFLNCDNNDTKKQLSEPGINELRRIVGKSELVFIDEAQRVLNIGLTLKLIIDQIPEVQLIVTGSSSLELSNLVNEPLTGRKFEYQLFPLSFQEISNHFGYIEAKRNLHQFIVFGTYPDVLNNPGNEPEVLSNLVSSYLFKDVFMYQDIRKPEFIEQLLEALAFQMGSEVSFHELAQLLKSDSHTVQRYISLLEKAFIIFRLRSFSRNVRNELKKSRKIYFYDNGIRNAILGNYSQLDSRTD